MPGGSSSARASATRPRCCTSASRSAGRGAKPDAPAIDIAVDPLEGTNLVAHGQAERDHGPRRVRGGGLVHAPDTYLEKLCVGPGAAGKVDIREPPAENLRPHRRGARPARRRHHGDHPRPAPPRRRSSPRSATAGARIKLISDGDLSAAISCAVSGTGVHAVMGIGGAPEGVITAAAMRCLGGEIQARFRYRNDDERERGARMGHGDEDRIYITEDLAPGENLVFAATGVTAGDLLEGVRFFGGGARTHSLVDGLPDQEGPLRRHRPHVRPGPPAARPAVAARRGATPARPARRNRHAARFASTCRAGSRRTGTRSSRRSATSCCTATANSWS